MEILSPPDVKPERPPGRKPKHSESFRWMVAEKVCKDGMSYREAGKTFGLSHGSISALVKKYNEKNFKTKRKERTSKYAEQVEGYRQQSHVNDLKLQIAELYLENLMLKKMLEHSLQKKKESSSDITSENLDLLPARAK